MVLLLGYVYVAVLTVIDDFLEDFDVEDQVVELVLSQRAGVLDHEHQRALDLRVQNVVPLVEEEQLDYRLDDLVLLNRILDVQTVNPHQIAYQLHQAQPHHA